MKLIELSCPHCGAHLKVDPSIKQATCEHCGAALLIDDEVQRVQYDNAEEAGYKFEKGRQRAQAEAHRTAPTSYQSSAPKKRKTWLWVLGWIFIFPLPLTIILLRKKEMKPAIKYGIIAVAWIIYLLICVGSANSKGNSTQDGATRSSQTVVTGNIRKLEFMKDDGITIEVGDKTSPSWVLVSAKDKKAFKPEDVVFVSDDPSVATISYDHQAMSYLYYVINAVGPGETEVYAKAADGDAESTHIKVTVPKPIEVDSIIINSIENDLTLGENVQVNVQVYPDNANDKSLSWSSSNSEIAIVDSNGMIKAVGGGTATITATSSSGKSNSIDINVDASKRTMELKVTRERTDDFNIGDEWSYTNEINGERTSKNIIVSVGDVLQFHSKYTESDNNPDVGEAYATHQVTADEYNNGFEVKLELYVTENGGQNRGESAHFIVTYKFTS